MKNPLFLLCAAFLFYFQMAAQPSVTSFSPASGHVGTTVTITGTNFSTIPTNNIVYFGAVQATVTASTTSSLTVIVPSGATYQPISVTTNSLAGYSDKSFVVTFSGGMTIANNPDQTQNSFDAPLDFTTDLHPNGIAVSDFDGDGRPDIATPNNYSKAGSPASVSVLRNISTIKQISFAPKMDMATGVLTFAIAAGDINGDGKPDLVATSIYDKTLSVFKNISTVGNIAFDTKIDLQIGSGPNSVTIGDLDNDGKPDLVVVNEISATISVYRNTSSRGDISFASKIDFATSMLFRFVSIGDFDHDGKVDLVVSGSYSPIVSVFKNQSSPGTISFASNVDFATGGSPYGVAVGDINNDGWLDIATANNNTNSISVLRNTSGGGIIAFATKVDFSCGPNPYGVQTPYSVSIADLNGDGNVDIVVASSKVSVFQNNSSGNTIAMASVANPTMYGPFIIGISDFDGDGKNDLAGAIFTSTNISVTRNRNNEPSISSYTPNSGFAGTIITITGSNFDGVTGVSFGGVPAASFNIVNKNTITATLGSGASGSISLTNQYGTGTMDGFLFYGKPSISSFTPTAATPGATVTINGVDFTGATSVSFGGVAATSFKVLSSTKIEAVTGSGTSGYIAVKTPGGTDSLSGFTYLPAPTLISFTPSTAATGQSVTITGINFTGVTNVSFGGIAATSFTIDSPTQLKAVVGAGASGSVIVSNTYGTGSLTGFNHLPPPQIGSFSPTSGGTGTIVTILGTNFNGATAVSFGGLAANSYTVNSSISITAVVGAGANGSINVTAPGGTASATGFTFLPPPNIHSITPSNGPAGTVITINGSNFGTSVTSNKVTIGSVEAGIINASSTTLRVTAPEVTTNKKITVTANNMLASSQQAFLTTFSTSQSDFTAASFPSQLAFKGGGAPYNLVSADIDGDKKLDIIVPNLFDKKVAILRNTSASTISFAPKVEITPYWVPDYVDAGDLDGDGKIDLVVGNGSHSNKISVFKNTSTPRIISFAPSIEYSTSFLTGFFRVHLCDLDGDGRVDLLARTGDANVSVYLNTSTIGKISFAPPLSFTIGSTGSSLKWLLAEDLDGDGKPEIITNGNAITIFKNLCTPGSLSFASSPYTIGVNTNPSNLSVTDVDGDGIKDIIAFTSTFNLNVYKNLSTSGNFTFTAINVFTSPTGHLKDVKMADLNGDGKPEIIYVHSPSQYEFCVLKNNSSPGNVSFAPKVNYPCNVSQSFSNIEITDMNGDNSMDLIFTQSGSDSIFIFHNQIGYAAPDSICEGSNTSMTVANNGMTYQWQVNTGNGFVDVKNNGNYNGATAPTLQLINIPSSFNGYRYRCQINDSSSLIFPLFVSPILSPAITISYTGCLTDTLLFSSNTINAGNGATIEWYVGNVLSGTGPIFTLNNAVNGTQVYAKLISTATCTNTPILKSAATTINCVTTGIPNINVLETFMISPNPTTGAFSVQMNLRQMKRVAFKITDSFGKLIYERAPVKVIGIDTQTFDLSGKAPGIYYLQTTIGTKWFVEKIVLIR